MLFRPAGPGLLILLAVFLPLQDACAAVPLRTYGQLPQLEDLALSPDGQRLAFIRTQADTRFLGITSLADGKLVGGLRLGDNKIRSVSWADDDHLLLTSSVTTGGFGYWNEAWQLTVYDLRNHRTRPLIDPSLGVALGYVNVARGSIATRRLGEHTVLFVQGTPIAAPRIPVLVRADLQTGRVQVMSAGTDRGWYHWLVDGNGEVVARQSYDENSGHWSIAIRRNGVLGEIASGQAPLDYPQLLGFGPQPDTLLVQEVQQEEPVWRLLSLRDGSFGAPMPERQTLDEPIESRAAPRMVGGVRLGDSTGYVFFDPALQQRWDVVLHAYPGARLRFVSSSAEFERIVARVDGPQGLQYQLIDTLNGRTYTLGDVYEGLHQPLEVRRITYPADDGLPIAAYLTLPRHRPAANLPLIVLPHGGPAAHDTADFGWWPQALANEGYAVLQPNYRGSDSSPRLLAAGFGEWGRRMQTDLSEGVRYLVTQGVADPARVCIVGASYGGYAALAGVALQNGIYRCAVSVSGIADLPEFLRWVSRQEARRQSHNQRFWDRFMGVSGPDDPRIGAISPESHVGSISVPVLLIHGRDDTVVPFEQSRHMYRALRSAGKQADLVTLRDEDHWLSRSSTRLRMLETSVAFLKHYNPP
ncbi:MAG: S9 family peptidase [Proteobacteria bacterium]|nr:S9 family peptidase [Pseudomonadota bacterium]